MKTENLLKISIVAVAFVAILAIPIFAQTTSAKFKEIFFLGKGVVVSTSNSQDIQVIKMGVAQITVNVAGTDTDVTIGILYFGEDKYVLKDVVNGNGTSQGNIYLNNSVVGNYNLNLISKPSDNIWAGTLTLNGVSYNAYLLEAHRTYTASEESSSVADYCKNNPSDTNCRSKIEDFCQNNPTDQRCIALLNNHCKSHLLDGRCREELGDFCKNQQQNNPTCQGFCQRYPDKCGATTSSTTTTSQVVQTTTTSTTSMATSTSTMMTSTTSVAVTTTTTTIAPSTTTTTVPASSTTTTTGV